MIDLRALSLVQNPTERRRLTAQAFNEETDLCLSDLLQTNNTAALIVRKLLEEESREGRMDPQTRRKNPALRRTWRIKILSDEWGNPVKPGSTLEWKAGLRRRDENGRKFTGWDINEMRREGNDEAYVIYHAAVVDADGCITVEFHDAALLIGGFGVHFRTGLPISKQREFGKGPKLAPDGQMRHKRNWLYMEVPPGTDPKTIGATRRTRGGLNPVPADPPVAPSPATPDATPAPERPKRGRKPKAAETPPETPPTTPEA